MSSRLQCRPLHFVCSLWNFSLLPCSVPQGTALSPGTPGPLFWVPHHRFPTSGSWRWLGLLLPTWMVSQTWKGSWVVLVLPPLFTEQAQTTFHSYTLSSLTIGHLSKARVLAHTVTKRSFRLFFHVYSFLISSPLIFLLHFHLSQFYPLKLHPVSKASNVSFSPSLKSNVISLSFFLNLLCLFTKLHFFCRFLGASLEA